MESKELYEGEYFEGDWAINEEFIDDYYEENAVC